jgi:hypothetical protein
MPCGVGARPRGPPAHQRRDCQQRASAIPTRSIKARELQDPHYSQTSGVDRFKDTNRLITKHHRARARLAQDMAPLLRGFSPASGRVGTCMNAGARSSSRAKLSMADAMDWSQARRILAETNMPSGYTLSAMARSDVPEVVRKLREWYPDITVGAESYHLDPEFYYRETTLEEAEREPSIFPIVARHHRSIVAMMTVEQNSRARTITSRMGAIDPDHRGPGLALLGPLLLQKIGRATGAELAYYFATLKSAHQQVLAERAKYQLVGIVPGFDRDMVRPGEVKRVYEALYAKLLVEQQALVVPLPSALTAQTRALWRSLFGEPPPTAQPSD